MMLYWCTHSCTVCRLLAREQDLEKLKEENSTLKEKLDKSEKSLEEYKVSRHAFLVMRDCVICLSCVIGSPWSS